MWSIPTRKYSGATPSSKRKRLGEGGQAVLEYVLILMMVVGFALILGRPFLSKLGVTYQSVFKSGMFAADSSGSKFYYFPVK